MKVLFLFIMFCLLINQTHSHEQEFAPVHQRIVYEAYKLLKLQLSNEENGIANVDQYIGDVRTYGQTDWQEISTITGGASHEDDVDIIWNTLWSRTHFWYTDNPDESVFLITGRFHNAYKKALKFMWDDYPRFIESSSGGLFWTTTAKMNVGR